MLRTGLQDKYRSILCCLKCSPVSQNVINCFQPYSALGAQAWQKKKAKTYFGSACSETFDTHWVNHFRCSRRFVLSRGPCPSISEMDGRSYEAKSWTKRSRNVKLSDQLRSGLSSSASEAAVCALLLRCQLHDGLRRTCASTFNRWLASPTFPYDPAVTLHISPKIFITIIYHGNHSSLLFSAIWNCKLTLVKPCCYIFFAHVHYVSLKKLSS